MVAVTIADETSLTNPGHHIFATSKITQGYDFHFNFYRSIAAVNSEDETSLQRPIQDSLFLAAFFVVVNLLFDVFPCQIFAPLLHFIYAVVHIGFGSIVPNSERAA